MDFGSAWGRRKVKNRGGTHALSNRRPHWGRHRWGPIRTGGGFLGIIQFRECEAAGRTETGVAICPEQLWRNVPKLGLGGKADVDHEWKRTRRR